MKRLVPLVLALFAWGCLIGACRDPKLPEPTIAQKETAAGASFTTQLVACATVDGGPTEADTCAAKVRKAWHRLPDGGRDVSR